MKDYINKNRILLTTLAGLVFLYLALIFAAPKLTLWSLASVNSPSGARLEALTEGEVYECDVQMPYDRISGIDPHITYEDEAGISTVVPVDADLELIAGDGSTVCSKHITSALDSELTCGYINVTKDASYTLRITVNSVDLPDGALAPSLITDGISFAYEIRGCYNGAPDKITFSLIYLVFAAVILLYVHTSGKETHPLKRLSEPLLLWTICLTSIVLLSQIYDMQLIVKSALKVIESLKAGNLTGYYDYAYSSSLIPGSDITSLGYNYDLLLILPVAAVLFPLSFFMTSDTETYSLYTLPIIILTFLIFVLILATGKLINRICSECGMSSEYAKTARRMFIFSPFMLSASILFGQIDMIYVFVTAAALLFYFKGHYKTFTALMAVAISMKVLPLLIFLPLILLVKKKPLEIIAHSVGSVSVMLLSTLIFKGGSGYAAIMNMVDLKYGFADMVFSSRIGLTALFPLAYTLILIYAYATDSSDYSKKDLLKTSMFLIFATYSAFAAFSAWHVQWMIPLIFSLSFLLPMYHEDRAVMTLGTVSEIMLILCSLGGKAPSTYMTDFILPDITGYTYWGTTVSAVYNTISPYFYILLCSVCAGVLASLCYFFLKRDGNAVISGKEEAKLIRFASLRITILYALVIMLFWCYWYIG